MAAETGTSAGGDMAEPKDAQLLTFKLDDQEYALDLSHVVQVVRMVAITRAPNAPEVVEGLVNVRGRIIPVVNLRKRLGLPAVRHGIDSDLVIARANDRDSADGVRMMAFIVDAVNEVLRVPTSDLDLSADIGAHFSEHLEAVGKLGDRLLLILDLGSLLTLEEREVLAGVLESGAPS